MKTNKKKVKENCPFCNIKENFNKIYFSDKNDVFPGEGWIEYKKKRFSKKFFWYAKLNGDQYTPGNTLVILGKHMDKISGVPKRKELKSIILGINKITTKLKKVLHVETVHILSLCESQEHLHFHLIPRYKHLPEEKHFVIENYKDREINNYGKFIEKVKQGKFHGMWYAAYQEMNYKKTTVFMPDSDPNFERERYFGQDLNKRIEIVKELANKLRPKGLKNPFN